VRTRPIHISDSVRDLILETLTYDQLQHLAAIRRAGSPRALARRSLDRASAEDLADMIVAGGIPTIGWWSRHAA